MRSCRRSQDGSDDLHKLLPLDPTRRQSLDALLREPIDTLPGATPRGGLIFPSAGNQPRPFQTVEGRVQRSFLQPQRPASGLGQAPQDLEAVCVALFEGRQGHRLQVPPECITADGFHAFYLDYLSRTGKRWWREIRRNGFSRRVVPKSTGRGQRRAGCGGRIPSSPRSRSVNTNPSPRNRIATNVARSHDLLTSRSGIVRLRKVDPVVNRRRERESS